MKNPLSKSYSFFELIKFTLPTIVMMVFMSMYTMVDGVFVSMFVGTDALSSVNIVYPVLSVIVAVAIMLATGGSAVIARKMGENKAQEAKENFTLIAVVGVIIGLMVSLVSLIFLEDMITLLGANAQIYEYCYDYAFMLILFLPMGILQMLFQYLFVTAGKPHLGLILTMIGGVANIILDYICIVPLNMGISGAAFATGIGFSIPAVFGLVYFSINKKGTLYFVRPKWDFGMLLEVCGNGSSEMVTNLAVAITTFLFNIIMMNLLGPNGVASITIVLYSQFLLSAIYLGYSSGVAPIISYHYGDGNTNELRNIFKISTKFLLFTTICTIIFAMSAAPFLTAIFTKKGSEVYFIAVEGFRLFACGYFFMGANIFASALFTSLSNGRVSAVISFARTFLFLIPSILLLPDLIGLKGVWLSVPLAEGLALIVSVIYIYKLKGQYQYLD